jgi:hypothetical protein
MPLKVNLVAATEELPSAVWSAAGPHATRARLTDLERDPRFDTRFAVVSSDDKPVLALPIYSPKLARWTDPAYDVSDLLESAGAATDFCLLGGRADLHCHALLTECADERLTEAAAELAIRTAREAAAGRRCALLYVEGLLHQAAVSVGVASSAVLGHRYVMTDVGANLAEYLSGLGSTRRNLVRRDLRRLGERAIRAEVCEWSTVLDEAAPLVAAVKSRHRRPDLPALVHYRLGRRSLDPDVTCVAFAIRAAGRLAAVTLGWTYGSTLELYEIGLADASGEDRGLHYLEAMFYAPLRFMWSHGLRTLDLALESGHPKTLRGATGHPLAGLLLQ